MVTDFPEISRKFEGLRLELVSRNVALDQQKCTPGPTHTLGCLRVSNGCHRKFRGHNFESCVSNFNKFSFFLFAPAKANFVDFTPLRINSYCGEQYAEPHPHARSRLSAAHTITMSLFYQTITVRQYPALTSVRGGF